MFSAAFDPTTGPESVHLNLTDILARSPKGQHFFIVGERLPDVSWDTVTPVTMQWLALQNVVQDCIVSVEGTLNSAGIAKIDCTVQFMPQPKAAMMEVNTLKTYTRVAR